MSSLQGYMERTWTHAHAERVLLVTQDGRVLLGTLRGYDALGSLVLSHCIERIFSADAGVEEVPLGVYVLRGDSMYVPLTTYPARLWATSTWSATAKSTGARFTQSPSRLPNTCRPRRTTWRPRFSDTQCCTACISL